MERLQTFSQCNCSNFRCDVQIWMYQNKIQQRVKWVASLKGTQILILPFQEVTSYIIIYDLLCVYKIGADSTWSVSASWSLFHIHESGPVSQRRLLWTCPFKMNDHTIIQLKVNLSNQYDKMVLIDGNVHYYIIENILMLWKKTLLYNTRNLHFLTIPMGDIGNCLKWNVKIYNSLKQGVI